jgi:putative transposase
MLGTLMCVSNAMSHLKLPSGRRRRQSFGAIAFAGTLRYQSRRVFDEVLRHRLRELAGTHVRYGYRRLTVLLRREGWHVNAKRIYRLYRIQNASKAMRPICLPPNWN